MKVWFSEVIPNCAWCGSSVFGDDYIHISLDALNGAHIAKLDFCKQCFERNDLQIRTEEDYSDYLQRVAQYAPQGQIKKPS
jgi:hypothetical protein